MKETFQNKNILITGGTGSVGSNLAKSLLKYEPRAVRIFDNDEESLFYLQEELGHEKTRFLLGDIRDINRLKMAVEDIDIIFHAAALKHVPLCEYNPFEAVKTNVIGTQNVIEAALAANVHKVVNLSTDKAMHPINTMGATKLLAERLVSAANYYTGKSRTIFSSVRFGNVIGSSGSILPLFKKQIKERKMVTITDPEMTRYTMSMPEAIYLCLKTVKIMHGGETFIFKMPAYKVGDLAEVLIEELSPKYGFRPEDIKIEYIGPRGWEKCNEALMTDEEKEIAIETKDMFVILPRITNQLQIKTAQKTRAKKIIEEKPRVLTKEEVKNLLYREKLI